MLPLSVLSGSCGLRSYLAAWSKTFGRASGSAHCEATIAPNVHDAPGSWIMFVKRMASRNLSTTLRHWR